MNARKSMLSLLEMNEQLRNADENCSRLKNKAGRKKSHNHRPGESGKLKRMG